MRCFPLLAAALSLAAALLLAASSPAPPPAERQLTDPVRDLPLFMQVRELRKQGAYDGALAAAREMLAQLEADPGAKVYELLNRRRLVRDLEAIAALPPDARRQLGSAEALIDPYRGAMDAARWEEAGELASRRLAVLSRHLGERHHDVATSLHLLGLTRKAQGRYAEAEALFARSKDIYTEILGPRAAAVAMSEVAHGDLFSAAGSYDRAVHHYAAGVAIYRRDHPENVDVIARGMGKLARALRLQGDLREAEIVLRESLALWRLGSADGSVATNASDLASVLRAQGERERAEPLYREALAARIRERNAHHPDVAAIQADLAGLLFELGRREEAEDLRRRALGIRSESFGAAHPEVAQSLQDLAASRLAAGDPGAADSLYRASIAAYDAAERGPHAGASSAYRGFGDVARTERDLDAARGRYAESLRLARAAYGAHHREVTSALVELARVAWMQGSPEDAAELLAEAAVSHEGSRRRLDAPVHRSTFHPSPDPLLAAALLECGREEDAWAPAERFQARILEDVLLAAGKLPSGGGISAAEAARALDPDAAMIGWLETEPWPGRISAWAWVLRRDQPLRWVPLEALPVTGRGSVADALREAMGLAASWPFRVAEDPRVRDAARRLAQSRLDPLAPHLESVRHVVVVPSGSLVGVPIELLVDSSERARGDAHTISYQPSATAHAWLRERPRPRPGGAALVVGDPLFARELPALPASAEEVERVARALGGARVLRGADASEKTLAHLAATGELSRFRTIHFATHAIVDPLRPELSSLALSAEGNPLESALAGERVFDGRLCAWEIARDWQLSADLATLSGCGTALGRRIPGEGYLGFAHAFLLAGARSLVLSLWKVDDESTAMLMGRFYDNLAAGSGKAEALAEAREWLRARHPHPAYWAAFILVGDPR